MQLPKLTQAVDPCQSQLRVLIGLGLLAMTFTAQIAAYLTTLL